MNAPQELLKQYVQSQNFTSTADIMAAMKDMFRDVIQQVMEVEMDEELGRERCHRATDPENVTPNYRNGYSQKTVKTQLGDIDIKVPRDRKGNYEPKIISKYDRNAEGMEDKILSLYACGMSQRDIAEQIKSLYDVEISPELVSKISEKIMPEVNAWQNRPLERIYPFIFMDAIHYKVKEDHRYVTKAAYVVLGITMDGRKDILGVWIGEHESSKFWLSVLNDLKSRGVLDVYLFCTDGLCGMMQAIQAQALLTGLAKTLMDLLIYMVNWRRLPQVRRAAWLLPYIKILKQAYCMENATPPVFWTNNLVHAK